MPVTHRLDAGVLHVHAAGHYEPTDLPRAFLAGLADPACPAPVALLLDVRESEMVATRSPEQVRAIAEFLEPYTARIGGRCAVVVSRDSHFGMARMGAVYAGQVGVEANVFRSVEEAVAWLKSGRSSKASP